MTIVNRPPIPVASTPDEFNACWSSGQAFQVSEELAAQMGPRLRGRNQRRRVFRAPRSERTGCGLADEC